MKNLALPVLALMLAIGAQAQTKQKNHLGITGGMNFPMDGFSLQETGDNINSIFTGEERSTGWHVGLMGRVYATEQLYFGSNLLYTSTDHTLTGLNGDQIISETFNRSGSQLDVLAGLELFGFLRGYGGLNGNINFDSNWNSTFDTFSAGYLFGAGVDVWRFTVDVRYYGSFKDHTGNWNNIPLSYNRSDLMIGVGFKF